MLPIFERFCKRALSGILKVVGPAKKKFFFSGGGRGELCGVFLSFFPQKMVTFFAKVNNQSNLIFFGGRDGSCLFFLAFSPKSGEVLLIMDDR